LNIALDQAADSTQSTGLFNIASELVEKNTRCSKDLTFTIHHLTEMLLNLRNKYRAAWDGGDALAYRLIRYPATTTEEIKEALSHFRLRSSHEAPAPIGTEAQPATDRGHRCRLACQPGVS
jgi:hypothetical protein